jgi:hypothetical protein
MGMGAGTKPEEKIYLVTWQDADGDGLVDLSGDLAKDCRRYFCVMDDGDGSIEDNELIAENERAVIDAIRPTVTDNSGMAVRFATDREELQNFANWVTYYRRRSQTAIAIAAKFILHAGADNVGLYAINGRPRVPVRSFGTDGTLSDSGHGTERSDALLDALYAMQVGENRPFGTPLTRSVDISTGTWIRHWDHPPSSKRIGAEAASRLPQF